jgi:hypothetical protein
MILGTSICPDTIEVDEAVGSDTGDFVMKFKIFEFQKRMRVSTHIDLEFIARGKIVNSTTTYRSKSDSVRHY